MPFENAAQQIVFAALSGNLTCPVYDDAPFLPEGAPASGFPYVVIGNDTARAWDTDDTTGAQVTVTIHVWSRSGGFAQTKAILAEIHARLHRASLTKAGFNVLDCLWEFSETMMDVDGETRHGIARYRMTLQDL